MISEDLLTSKGTINGIVALSSDESETQDLDSLRDEMDVARSTTRDRLESLQDAGLVEESAEIVDDSPTRVFSLTEDGEDLADNLSEILG